MVGVIAGLSLLSSAGHAGAAVTADFRQEDGHLEIRSDEASDVVVVTCVEVESTTNPYVHYWLVKVNGSDPAGGPAQCSGSYFQETSAIGDLVIRLGDGDDTLYLAHPYLHPSGVIWVDAGGGADEVNGGAPEGGVYLGGPGNDNLVGYGTVVLGQEGNDRIIGANNFGGAGDDTLYGGHAQGEEGDDVIYGSGSLTGGPGRDSVFGKRDADEISLGPGADFADGGGGADRIAGGIDADRLNGGPGWDELRGGDEDYFLRGGAGADLLRGSAGADRLLGEKNNDCMSGNAGDDVLFGGAGLDFLRGGRGSDELHGGPDGTSPKCLIA